ncbi:Eco57I restriction-modification methylase domain-containing protein [Paenarthrobacter ureafaciens]|uniref:Eco57I restriction-modification methylase domain-containing protein n=1 Tax=Paenarthrobacter ureafaciens TaxID=37931 RepID=UPI0034DB3EF4
MTTRGGNFSIRGRNPDVLSCIANLSNDEVFTPPEFASRMLDNLAMAWGRSNGGQNLWSNPEVTFLDPFTKSGVFLREVTSRLVEGLEQQMPDLDARVDHILTKQVFGIGVTHLTSLLARRSLYCSKWANGPHSIAQSFDDDQGNVWFKRTEHEWVGGTDWVYTAGPDGNQIRKFTNGQCRFCGASQKALDRGEEFESHAYAFIHTDDIKARVTQIFGDEMQFDVIIGNPPYQLNTDGHGVQARPIYQQFVEQAKKLEPRMLTMVIPARWFSGGMGLDDFRESMLTDDRLRSIDDYLTASDVFPGVGLKGGVCYFLWDRDNPGDCRVRTHYKGDEPSVATRPLLENGADIFIRFNEGLNILKKVVEVETGNSGSLMLPEDKKFMNLVSSIGAYGLDSTFRGRDTPEAGDLKVYRNGGVGYVARSEIRKEQHSFDKWKVFIGRAAPGTGNKDTYPHRIISTPFLGEPGSISSWTYMYIGPFDTQEQAQNVLSYLSCRLTRLLILLHKPSQDTTKRVYTFVPTQDWSKQWTDEMLFEKYGITEEEQAFIDTMVRPMDLDLLGGVVDA